MQIFHINSLTDLKKHNKRFKFDSGGFHCIYFGSNRNINLDIFQELKINVLFSDDIYKNKANFKLDYVNFIGDLSLCFTTKMWWATQTAAKFRNQLPFTFYKLQIVSKIVDQYSIKKLIVIDETYIFNRALSFYSKNNSIEFKSSISQINRIIFSIKSSISFFASIIFSFLKLFYKTLLAKYLFNKKVKKIKTIQPINIIKTFVYENSFDEKGQFIDKFFGELPTYLNNNGYSTVSLVICLGHYNRIIRKMAKDKVNMILPFELFISNFFLVKSFCKLVLFKLKPNKKIYFNDIDVTEFLNFYWKYNKRYEISLDHVLHYDGMVNFIEHFELRSFITTYENMPWEPMCLLALKELSPKTISFGYQHSNVPEFATNYFLSEIELTQRPLPDKIYTTGPIPKNIIEKNSPGKYPFIDSSCALRYKNINNKVNKHSKNHRRILVALDGIPDVYKFVNYVLSELSEQKNYEIIIRPHPILPMNKLKKRIQINYSKLNNVIISEGGLITNDFEKVSVVIYRESTVALQAIAFGLPVICFQNHPIISFDPLFELHDFKWNVDESEKLEPLLNKIYEMDDGSFLKAKQKAKLYIDSYFQKCTDDKILLFTNV